MKKLIIGAFTLSVMSFSCGKEEGSNKNNAVNFQPSEIVHDLRVHDLRLELVNRGKDLSVFTKVQLLRISISKLNQILTNELPNTEASLIKKLIVELPKFVNKERNNVAVIWVQLTKIIPQEDFFKMFFEIEDYVYKDSYVGNKVISMRIKNEIASMAYFKERIPTDEEIIAKYKLLRLMVSLCDSKKQNQKKFSKTNQTLLRRTPLK